MISTNSPFLLLVPIVLTASHVVHAFQLKRSRQASVASFRSKPLSSSTCSATETTSFREYLEEEIGKGSIDRNLGDVLLGVAQSCAEVSKRLKTHTLDIGGDIETTVNVQGEQQKGMDVVANEIFLQTLKSVDAVAAMASEEEEAVIYGGNHGQRVAGDAQTSYEIAFDPLDGSGNLDVNLPTGSIFGIAPFPKTNENEEGPGKRPFSQPGSSLVAAGYALYSASTELIISLGENHPDGVIGFTLLDPDGTTSRVHPEDRFVLSRTKIRCPSRGPYYSLNEAREPDWPEGLKRWIADAKRGQTTTGQKYSSRYVCSLCADLHRTLLQGGWAGNPRPHLRLLYEAAPLAFVIQAAGGKGSDGVRNLLSIEPEGLHDRVCVFLGSPEDIADLESYGDVQQVQAKRYDA